MSKKITEEVGRDKRYLKERWVNKDATFNADFAGRYKDVIREVIVAIALKDESTNYVRFESMVGRDKGTSKEGEETYIIELYSEDSGIGSHIRPKAESALKKGEEVIEFKDLRTNVQRELATILSSHPRSASKSKESSIPFVNTGFRGPRPPWGPPQGGPGGPPRSPPGSGGAPRRRAPPSAPPTAPGGRGLRRPKDGKLFR